MTPANGARKVWRSTIACCSRASARAAARAASSIVTSDRSDSICVRAMPRCVPTFSASVSRRRASSSATSRCRTSASACSSASWASSASSASKASPVSTRCPSSTSSRATIPSTAVLSNALRGDVTVPLTNTWPTIVSSATVSTRTGTCAEVVAVASMRIRAVATRRVTGMDFSRKARRAMSKVRGNSSKHLPAEECKSL